jgi:signal transduction histidine kinase
VLDAGIAAVAVVLVAITILGADVVGAPIAGPTWLVAAFPFLLGLPLLWRRIRPLEAWIVIMGALVVQAVVTADSPEGLEVIFAVGAGCYAVAAYTQRWRAVAGLAIALAGYGVYAGENRDIRSGRTSDLWAGAFFGIGLLACWLVGRLVRELRDRRTLTRRTQQREAEADRAVADERARLARELHDIVSHKLSVVVVQAAGARAQGGPESATLEKIERSGRESLVEMRRLLGVLRADDADATLVPQPGIGDLTSLVEHVRDAGVPVELTVHGACGSLPVAIELSVYRIVQEALTNVVRHAGAAHATVTVCASAESVQVDVVDDGSGVGAVGVDGGHGLIGMRERVALLHGELHTGARPGGGFQVSATLPISASG